VVALVIARLARHGGSISLFVRFVKSYLSLYILLSRRKAIFDRNPKSPQVTLATVGGIRLAKHPDPGAKLGAHLGSRP
jgi:hypothetical protein